MVALTVALALGACSGDDLTDTGPKTDTDADADTDSDADSDSDADTDTDTDTDTDSDTDVPPLEDISVLLATVPAGTTWAALDPAIQVALEAHAEQALAVYRAEWDSAGIAAKEAVLAADSGAIRAQFEQWVTTMFPAASDATFDLAAVDPDLGVLLEQLYVTQFGTARNTLLWIGVSSTDWDAVTPLIDPPMPDAIALADLQAHAAEIADGLDGRIAVLSGAERSVAEQASFTARSLRTGSTGGFGYGGDDLQVAGTMGTWGPEPMWDDLYLGAFATAEELLRVQNAMWLGADLKYLSANNVAVATGFTAQLAGPLDLYYPDDPDTGRVLELMRLWWLERLEGMPGASDACYPYDDAERGRIIDAFTADLQLPDDPNWLPTFDLTLDDEGALLTETYRQAAIAALDVLFDDTALPPDARADVVAAIAAEPAFGAVVDTTLAALTAATGNGDAATAFGDALLAVPSLGGAPVVDPLEAAVVDQIWSEVRGALVARYSGPARVIDIDANLPQTVTVDPSFGIRTDAATGDITVGLAIPQPVPMMYLILTHEALHSLEARAGLYPTGTAIEGAASLTEHAVGFEVMSTYASPSDLPFWMLTAPLASDARRYGISDATIAVLQTDCANGLDSAVLATDAAGAWGMTGDALLEVPIRSHFGTQFLAYLAGQFAYRESLAWFDDQIRPGVDDGIDPFDLATCGMPNPTLTADEVAALTACLGG
ncbi:MAG: hypothetical protein ABMB14_12060 [Myxococcota bacterium]